MALDCPHCAVPMVRHRTQPPGHDEPIQIDECDRCRGVWLDRGEADMIAPIVADLHERHIEIVALGTPGGGIARCPRCGEIPAAFKLLDLEVDYCPECGGVWLDGPEAAEHYKPLEGQITTGGRGPYRAVKRAADTEEVRCAECSQRVALAETSMTGDGLVCWPCRRERLYLQAEADLERAMAEEAAPEHSFVKRFLGALRDALATTD
jgi:Zn-finger nucleic acid-binding protein